MGNFSSLTPRPPKRRRPTEEVPAQPRRPDWADDTEESDRKDIDAFGNKLAFRVYYNIERMIREAGGALSKNQEWFAGNTDGPMRKIVSELFGVGRTSVGNLKEHKESGAVLRSAFPRRQAERTRAKYRRSPLFRMESRFTIQYSVEFPPHTGGKW